jgi:hypothetical protein
MLDDILKTDDPSHSGSLAAFARIEFPEVTHAMVKKALQPTTREGRRQSRAPGSCGAGARRGSADHHRMSNARS